MNNPTHPAKHAEIAASKTPEPPKTLSHNPWDVMIEVNSVVLYRASKAEGWFECVVTKVGKKTIHLKWRDYDGFKPFEVQRLSVGLICKVD